MQSQAASLDSIFRTTTWLLKKNNIYFDHTFDVSGFLEFVSNELSLPEALAFLPDLATLEWTCHQVAQAGCKIPANELTHRRVNPTLEIRELGWQGLRDVCSMKQDACPERKKTFYLIWKHPQKQKVQMRQATPLDLLALKIIAEDISLQRAAAAGNTTVGALDTLLYQAATDGLILVPPSRITRGDEFPRGTVTDDSFFSSPVFTLQWHLTQACDLSCRHCYDRSSMKARGLREAYQVLDGLFAFCQEHHVYGQVTFTGGNPFLYPHFFEVYQRAAELGFLTAILGNPVEAEKLDRMNAIQRPEFYQISLEGLPDHNDYIRGNGHFDRSLLFLDLLKKKNIYSMIMLTLTRDNMNQVLPLAELLRDKADLFTFNRLAAVGEGAALQPVDAELFPGFLEEYIAAADTNRIMSLKDNFFNILCLDGKRTLFGGCAGYGCGAAFNFVSLLPNGEVHACRKFPSPIGNISTHSFIDIYHCEDAKKYRKGAEECQLCDIRPVCGGCLAVSWASGQDIFDKKDPYCFLT